MGLILWTIVSIVFTVFVLFLPLLLLVLTEDWGLGAPKYRRDSLMWGGKYKTVRPPSRRDRRKTRKIEVEVDRQKKLELGEAQEWANAVVVPGLSAEDVALCIEAAWLEINECDVTITMGQLNAS